CDCATPCGAAAKCIVAEAEERHADLIVMTTHALTGSVAESVVGRSSVPVLVERAGLPIRREALLVDQPRLLVTLDGSRFAEAALTAAAGFAADLGARLTLLRIESAPTDGCDAADYLAMMGQHVSHQRPGVSVQTRVMFGEPASAIAAAGADPRVA